MHQVIIRFLRKISQCTRVKNNANLVQIPGNTYVERHFMKPVKPAGKMTFPRRDQTRVVRCPVSIINPVFLVNRQTQVAVGKGRVIQKMPISFPEKQKILDLFFQEVVFGIDND